MESAAVFLCVGEGNMNVYKGVEKYTSDSGQGIAGNIRILKIP